MKRFLLTLLLLAATDAPFAWESHFASPEKDNQGDTRFDNEHVRLTQTAMEAADAFDFMGSPNLEAKLICGTVWDFNSADLGWETLTRREFCPAQFAELPDFFHSMEDYLNQGKACPPTLHLDIKECHSFEHFMGALNSSHFPPQVQENYKRYHQIAQAVIDHSEELHQQLFSANAVEAYQDYWKECKMEALTYESIGQHYLQDQWAMGHMWYRWGGPDVVDLTLPETFAALGAEYGYPKAQVTYGKLVGAISGLIHGWKSTIDEFGLSFAVEPNDAMSYYKAGVGWSRPGFDSSFPGVGDLFLDQEGDFAQQMLELNYCSMEGFEQLRSFQTNATELDARCWDNLATNKAMDIGLNYSPSWVGTLVVGGVGTAKVGLDVSKDLIKLALIYRYAAFMHPNDTYIAEGFTSASRDTRLTLFGMSPNDVYREPSSYIDPAREAPGDSADTTGVQPDNVLFGVRQVRYFNRCHTNLYCEDASIINRHRTGCQAGDNEYQDVDCQICEDLGARFFLGNPPICQILSPEVDPDPDLVKPPSNMTGVREWCNGTYIEPESCGVVKDDLSSSSWRMLWQVDCDTGVWPGQSDQIYTLREDGSVADHWLGTINGVSWVEDDDGFVEIVTEWGDGSQFVREAQLSEDCSKLANGVSYSSDDPGEILSCWSAERRY